MPRLPLVSMRTSLRAFAAAVVLAVAALAVLTSSEVVAQNVFNSDCLPPQSTYAGQFHAKYADGTNVYDLTLPRHADFTTCNPPPPPPGSTTHSFGSFVFAQVSINGGPPSPFQGPANTTVRVDYNHQTAQTRFFDTEMLQLDITGNAGVLVRESPTRQSTGKTSITDIGGGQFRIDSFFDIFTELSLDGGQTWLPSNDANGNPLAGHMEIPGTVAVNATPWSNVKSLYKD